MVTVIATTVKAKATGKAKNKLIKQFVHIKNFELIWILMAKCKSLTRYNVCRVLTELTVVYEQHKY